MSAVSPRLGKPAAVTVTWVLFAAAWLVRGGPLWWVSIVALITWPPPGYLPPGRFRMKATSCGRLAWTRFMRFHLHQGSASKVPDPL